MLNFHYDDEVEVLSLRLAPGPYVESEEVHPGVVLDFDTAGVVVGVEIHCRVLRSRADVDRKREEHGEGGQ